MNVSRRLIIIIFFVLVLLFIGLVFWPFIVNEIVKPVSIVVWLLLRVFILSIDQKYYWGGLIFALFFFLYRLLPQAQAATYPDLPESSNATLKAIGYWNNIFLLSRQDTLDNQILKRELIRLVISHYATKQSTTANYEIYEALQRGEIPLPEQIYAFLFAEDTRKTGHSLKKQIQAIGEVPQKWVRRITGQEEAEHKRIINEVLVFLETALEMKNDNEH